MEFLPSPTHALHPPWDITVSLWPPHGPNPAKPLIQGPSTNLFRSPSAFLSAHNQLEFLDLLWGCWRGLRDFQSPYMLEPATFTEPSGSHLGARAVLIKLLLPAIWKAEHKFHLQSSSSTSRGEKKCSPCSHFLSHLGGAFWTGIMRFPRLSLLCRYPLCLASRLLQRWGEGNSL